MKSPQLRSKTPGSITGHPLVRKGFAALFAGAVALGLGAGSALAQGPYYPGVATTPTEYPEPGTNPFIPQGMPITSSNEFYLIESNMPGTATLISPPNAGDHTASAAEYNTAVKAAATLVANGGGGSVTIASLTAEVAKYRSDLLQVQGALTNLAQGIAASAATTPNKQTYLESLAFTAGNVAPSGLAGANTSLAGVFTTAAGDATLASGVDLLVSQAINGAASSSALAIPSSSIYNVVSNAATAISSSPAGIPKPGILQNIGTAVAGNANVNGSTSNLDAATNALTTAGLQPHVSLNLMVTTIKNAVAVSDANYGAIAQGALRTVGNRTLAGYNAIKSGLGNTSYVTDLVDGFAALALNNTNAGTLAFSAANPEAVAAAAAVKYPASAGAAVGLILDNGYGSADRKDIVSRAVNAYQAGATAIADAAVGHGGVTPGEITSAAVGAAQLGSAGVISKAVLVKAGTSPANATDVVSNAITAAAAASPANKANAFADIAYNVSNALKLVPASSTAAVTQAVNSAITATTGVPATAPTYIVIVGALAGDQKVNFNAILAAGLAASGSDDDAATNAGAALVQVINTVPLSNYSATLTAAAGATTDAQRLSVLYAASLSNSGDAAGGLAALINASPDALAPDLVAAAISANRTKQTALTVAGAVAVHTKANPNDIQFYLGKQILTNPIYVKEITTAATVSAPQFSHFVAHTVAYNVPKSAYDAVSDIFLHSKITIPGILANAPDVFGASSRPAAGAAITAGLATGVLENTQLSAGDRQTALKNVIVESVKALNNPAYNDASVSPATFRQSTGLAVGAFTVIKAKGVAGGITGFVAQLVNPGDTTVSSDLTNALTQAAYASGSLTGTANLLDIAQAAGQAYGWVSGTPNRGVNVAATTAIANAIAAGYPFNLARITEAVLFGVDEAAGGTGRPGAGAAGLRQNTLAPYYDHHSAQGTPVSNIFTL
jgi:hypothetical protein